MNGYVSLTMNEITMYFSPYLSLLKNLFNLAKSLILRQKENPEFSNVF